MPQIDLVEETYIAADPPLVRARLAAAELARQMWPDLRLHITEDRGRLGLRYAVAGEFTGTAEVWFQEWADGVIVHVYLRVDPSGGLSPRRAVRELHRRQRAAKSVLWQVKDDLEAGRRAGERAGYRA
ncbi:MAG: hypothetical protein ACRDUA_18785 [Micromonosporaceae bacterium]